MAGVVPRFEVPRATLLALALVGFVFDRLDSAPFTVQDASFGSGTATDWDRLLRALPCTRPPPPP